jgi:RND superfamily putative drug exporter
VRVIAAIGQAIGVSVPSEVQPVIVVLLFGVMTDYTIFYLSRFRRRLREGRSRLDAARDTTAEITPTVVAAGLAVAVAGAALIAAELGFLRAFGPGIAMSVVVGLAVAVTFVPAMLAISGRVLFWPRRIASAVPASASEVHAESAPPRRGLVGLAVAHPWWTAGLCIAVLLGCASGLPRLEPGNPLIRGLPADSEPVVAYRQASRGFTPGVLSPTVVVVEAPGIAARRGALARLQRLLAEQRGVAGVAGPADQPLPRPIGAALSRTGDAARYVVIFDADPLGAAAIRRFNRLSERLPRLLRRAGLADAQASLAGDTALSAETVNRTLDDTGRVVPAVIVALFVVLAVFLRALVAPLYMLAVSALVVAASLGLAVYVVQDLRYGELTYYVPFAAAVLLVSLGSDYTMFLAGRVWEAAQSRSLNEAIVVGGSRAATSIAVAGGVLAASFAVLALVPLRPFRELAFIMAFGLLLDAFLVRPLLLPALMRIVGQRSAWPSRRVGGPRRRTEGQPRAGSGTSAASERFSAT